MAFKYLLLSLLLASTLASAYTSSRNPQAQSINWGPCNPNVTKKIAAEVDCGTLGVPLDYTVGSSTNNILQLDLVKVNATKQPPKGSILFNPGGPGKNGHDLVLSGRKAFSVVTGGDYDLIGFDPRCVKLLESPLRELLTHIVTGALEQLSQFLAIRTRPLERFGGLNTLGVLFFQGHQTPL
ncbi:MAG: hypothetical protein M1820_000706 [Bogoriella megaspora]|nr:MAG: hypothetical protein M1820_000706 [Bogoriella megaspora]